MQEAVGTPPGHEDVAAQAQHTEAVTVLVNSNDKCQDFVTKHKSFRVHLVGVLANGSSEIHLGPWSAPADAALDPSLFEFAVAIKKLISVTAAQDTWWRFEYTCYGNRVPILSDEALKEAFNYFRDQTRTLSPAEAAATCRLYLHPTSKPPPWTLTDYLSEPRLGFSTLGGSSNPGSQNTGDHESGGSGYNAATAGQQSNMLHNSHSLPCDMPTCSNAGSELACDAETAAAATSNAAVLPPAAAAAAARTGIREGGATSDSSSHEVPQYRHQHQQQQQQQLLLPAEGRFQSPSSSIGPGPAAAAAGIAVGVTSLPAVMRSAAPDMGSFSKRGRTEQQQQQQQQLESMPILQQHALDTVSTAADNNMWAPAATQQQQQQQLAAMQAAAAAASASVSLTKQVLHLGPARHDNPLSEFRNSKALKRTSSDSPKAQLLAAEQQQQQQQQLLAPWQQQQQVDITSRPLISPFATAVTHTASVTPVDRTVSMAAALQQQSGSLALPHAIHQAMHVAAAGSTVPSADSSGEAGLTLSGSFASLDQLQQLQLNSGNAAGGSGGSSSIPTMISSITPQQADTPGLALSQQQQQQQNANYISAGAAALYNAPQGVSLQLSAPAHYVMHQGAAAGLTLGNLISVNSNMSALHGNARSSAAAAAAANDEDNGAMQLPAAAAAASRLKSETKTKYADGRFKDEGRHQQRLSDMKARCDALFGGAIQGHFQIDHHKRVTCLVCNSTVVPYEAYHIDAVRKHFVRHHETWLVEAGVDVDLWRKSCAPIAKIANAAARGNAAAAAAAAGSSQAGEAAAAEAAVGDDDNASGRKGSSTRLADGRYKDPQQHQQRLQDMYARCAALFGGTMTQHWTINTHKSISCHLCQQNITPYAAYHPDCLRKHFVRRHEDVLTAAGVDVAAWSKGIPVGRRKLKALMQQQQQQVQEQQQQPVQGGLAMPLLLPGASQQQQQQQQGMLLPAPGQLPLWSWLQVQQQQQRQPVANVQTAVSGSVLTAANTTSNAQQDQQLQHAGLSATLMPTSLGINAAATSCSAAMNAPATLPMLMTASTASQQQQQAAFVGFAGLQQQQLSAAVHFTAPATTSAAAASSDTFTHLVTTTISGSSSRSMPESSSLGTLPLSAGLSLGVNAAAPLSSGTLLLNPHRAPGSSSNCNREINAAANARDYIVQQPLQQQQQQQQQHEDARLSHDQDGSLDLNHTNQQQQQQQQQEQRRRYPWEQSNSVSNEFTNTPPGFGPMSLSPACGLGLGCLSNSLEGVLPGSVTMGVIGSLTEADVAAMLDDDDDDYNITDCALADEILQQASQWVVQQPPDGQMS